MSGKIYYFNESGPGNIKYYYLCEDNLITTKYGKFELV